MSRISLSLISLSLASLSRLSLSSSSSSLSLEPGVHGYPVVQEVVHSWWMVRSIGPRVRHGGVVTTHTTDGGFLGVFAELPESRRVWIGAGRLSIIVMRDIA